ncbi:MAG: hypothetical protein ABSG68_00090 [Thermoguttaceae bacterium]|jgi:hypothetical protein
MTAELDLTPEEIAELKQVTAQSDLAAAVQVAAREYLQYARRQELKSLSGRIEMQDNWRQLEAAEAPARP